MHKCQEIHVLSNLTFFIYISCTYLMLDVLWTYWITTTYVNKSFNPCRSLLLLDEEYDCNYKWENKQEVYWFLLVPGDVGHGVQSTTFQTLSCILYVYRLVFLFVVLNDSYPARLNSVINNFMVCHLVLCLYKNVFIIFFSWLLK